MNQAFFAVRRYVKAPTDVKACHLRPSNAPRGRPAVGTDHRPYARHAGADCRRTSFLLVTEPVEIDGDGVQTTIGTRS